MRILSSFLKGLVLRMSSSRSLSCLAVGAGVLALGATPALANHINTAAAMTTCTSYVIDVNASQLVTGKAYTIAYTITLKPATGKATVVSGSVPFKASSGTFTDTITNQLNLITDNYTLSGTASLVGFNSISVSFSPNTLSCVCPD